MWHVIIGFNCLVCVPLVCYARGLSMKKDPQLFFHEVTLFPGAKPTPLLPVVAFAKAAF